MANYFFKYNGVVLSNLLNVKEASTTAIPPRENSTINIWGRNGEVFNGFKYGAREITVTFNIRPQNHNDYYNYINDIKSVLDCAKPSPLYIGNEDKYYLAVVDGDVNISDVWTGYGEGEVTFLALDPFLYSNNIKAFHGTKSVAVKNQGNMSCYPLISVGFSKDAHYLQVKNDNTKENMLIGYYPSIENASIKEKSRVLTHECQSTVNWTTSSSNIDSGRAVGGTLSVTQGGNGIMCGNFGSKSGGAIWHGCSARINLNTSVQNFNVCADFNHTSTGTNGDPTRINTDTKVETTPGTSSSRYYYQINCTALNVRTGPSTSYKRIGCITAGYKIYDGVLANGWVKHTYNGQTGYSAVKYLDKKVEVTTTPAVTTTTGYVVAIKDTILRSGASESSSAQRTIPIKTTLRVQILPEYEGFYRLVTPYQNVYGYVAIADVVQASNVVFETDVETITADDKCGLVELYGFTAEGIKLFKFSLTDDNQFYEFTYPKIQVGNKDFLQDVTNAPAPTTRTTAQVGSENQEATITTKQYLSGQYGDWNDFYGTFQVRRQDNVWYAEIQKKANGAITKVLKSNYVSDGSLPKGNLSYLVVYFGQYEDQKVSDMSLENLYVDNLTPATITTQNLILFKQGDVVDIDCYNNLVFLNDEPYMKDLDIGSTFFETPTGESTFKFSSDDNNISSSVIFNEKFL